MSTTLNKLEYLDTTKGQIKTALNQFGSGITDSDTFRSYVSKINDIYDNWDKVTGEATSVTLDNTKISKLIINPKGNITQVGDPSPDNEIPVKVVDGEYEVEVENKNLFDKNNANVLNNVYIDMGANKLNSSENTNKVLYIPIIGGETYTVQKILTNRFTIATTSEIPALNVTLIDKVQNNNATNITLSTSSGAKYLSVHYLHSSDTLSENVILSSIQIEKGSTATSYIAHAEQTQTIDTSPNPLYSQNDYYYKSNGNWYVHNEWVKYVVTGQEDWVLEINNNRIAYYGITSNSKNTTNQKCNYIKNAVNYATQPQQFFIQSNNIRIYNDWGFTSDSEVKTEFQRLYANGTPLYFYYEIDTPTNTQITNTTLIEQLEALLTLTAYQDQTNISQTHNTTQADVIISASALKKGGN
jgi:hypothetical protein